MGNKSNYINRANENIKLNDYRINNIDESQINKDDKIKINIKNKINEPPPKIVVGIDLGSSGIGYAYGFYNNQNQIFLSDLNGQSSDRKVPTEIILDKDLQDILAFGHECSGYIKSHDKNTYEYFKNIKMNLYKKIYKVKSTNGKEANIENIIAKILKKVSKEAISQIKRNNDTNIKEEEIKWVVTIPAIWEEKSKQIMIDASRAAGLISENTDLSLFLALEPEAAGIYYNSSIVSFRNININKPFIICDIGAGTVDICTHRKIIKESSLLMPLNSHSNENSIFDCELIEEYPPIGGDLGGNVINEEFIKRLIIELFGEEKVKLLQNDLSNEDWDKFEKEIESLKRKYSDFEPVDFKLDCSLFEDENNDKKLDDYIREYNNKNHKYKYQIKKNRKWELLFPSQIFSDITKEIAEKIFLRIEEIYKNVHTGEIITTGAGSKNTNFYHYFYDFAKEKNMDINISSTPEPDVAIIKGAVLFGFNSNIIRKRQSKYTIGIQVHKNWNEKKHKDKGIKIYNEFDGNQCSNLFSKFITRNQYIEFDEIISKTLTTIKINPSIVFYKTLKENCIYIDEKDENDQLIIHKFGEVEFNIGEDFDKNFRDVRIDLKMGGTYIYASAVYLKTGKKIKTLQNFI